MYADAHRVYCLHMYRENIFFNSTNLHHYMSKLNNQVCKQRGKKKSAHPTQKNPSLLGSQRIPMQHTILN